MARNILVILLSEQSVPNVLFIKENREADSYLFISTRKMEERDVSKNIIKSCSIDKKQVSIIEVIEDSLSDIETKLMSLVNLLDDDEVRVNITGGTKIMSLGIYNYFARHGAVGIYYIPLGKNEILQVFPMRKNFAQELKYRINLWEYLSAYGVTISEKSMDSKNSKPFEDTEKIFKIFCSQDREAWMQVSEVIRLNYRGKKVGREKLGREGNLYIVEKLEELGYIFDNRDELSRKETKYLTGDWFEEYIYYHVKNGLQLKDDEIGMGVELVKSGAKNEYDVIFTKDNVIYVIECKTDISDKKEDGSTTISLLFTNTLYKAATLKKEFGLWVNYYVFALNDFSALTEDQRKRARQLDIKLVGLETLRDKDKFTDFIRDL